ncbi:TPA: hypothetical protein DDW35_00755, partial [Candidatus Sumerlaeota bacterium]|nr:hypothetical protein [Candidatus Sumerlaeota bacterium]
VDKPNRHQYTVQCDVGGILVLNEYRDLAWKVYVDGVRKPLLAVNGTQMGVIIPSGGHLVEFRYLPGIFFRSLAIGVLGVCLVILVAVYLRLKRSGVVRELEISVQDMPGNVLP